MKGIVFCGCSFTWGQGLWYYSNLENMFYPENEYNFNIANVKHPELRYKDTIRFPRLVANHFSTFELVKKQNGGCEDDSINFIQQLFHGGNHSHLTDDRFSTNDISYIFIQTSQLARNRFYFELDGQEEWAIIWNSNHGENIDKFLRWIDENELSFDDWKKLHIKNQMDRLKDIIFQYDNNYKIRVRIFCWENDYLDYIKNDEILNKHFFTLKYNNQEFDSISDMMNKNRSFYIKYDTLTFITPPQDHHPSKKCHEVIAQNIINLIEEDIKTNPIDDMNPNFINIDEIIKQELENKRNYLL